MYVTSAGYIRSYCCIYNCTLCHYYLNSAAEKSVIWSDGCSLEEQDDKKENFIHLDQKISMFDSCLYSSMFYSVYMDFK